MHKLITAIERENIDLIEDNIPIKSLKGLYYDNTIIIDKRIETYAEKKCIVAEELGHHYTTVGNILDQSSINNIKQENKARDWAYNNVVGLLDFIDAYKNGCRNRFETAEYLDITEDFLLKTIQFYKRKYGLFFEVDNYIIYFEPFGILEIYK